MVFTYIASFTDYEDDIFTFISNLHVQGFKFDGKFDKFGRKLEKFGGKLDKFDKKIFFKKN